MDEPSSEVVSNSDEVMSTTGRFLPPTPPTAVDGPAFAGEGRCEDRFEGDFEVCCCCLTVDVEAVDFEVVMTAEV